MLTFIVSAVERAYIIVRSLQWCSNFQMIFSTRRNISSSFWKFIIGKMVIICLLLWCHVTAMIATMTFCENAIFNWNIYKICKFYFPEQKRKATFWDRTQCGFVWCYLRREFFLKGWNLFLNRINLREKGIYVKSMTSFKSCKIHNSEMQVSKISKKRTF